MAHPKEAVKQHDDLTVYARTYTATWTERGVVVHAYLEPVQDNDSRQGYQLDFAHSRESGPGRLGPRQEEIASEIWPQLRAWMLAEMQAAGWRVAGQRAGRDVWKPSQVPGKTYAKPVEIDQVERKTTLRNPVLPKQKAPPAPVQYTISEQETGIASDDQAGEIRASTTVLRYTRAITFTCQWCREQVTEQRYPSHIPLCCSKPACKVAQKEAAKLRAKERVMAWRKTHQRSDVKRKRL